jgi:histidine phosphotransferase ChpT
MRALSIRTEGVEATGGEAGEAPVGDGTATAKASKTRFSLSSRTARNRFGLVGLNAWRKPNLRDVGVWTINRAMNAVDLASLLCSRLCHDLMSPVGALNNGIELLADEQDPEMRAQCLELLGDSARATANKLKFFRLAFGAGGGFAEAIDANEAKLALQGIFGAERRIELGWMVAPEKLSKGAMKLLLNLALIAGDALVRGGRLDVGAETTGAGLEIAIRGEGPRVMLDAGLREMLTRGAPDSGDIEPRVAGAWLAKALAAEAGGTIQLSEPAPEVLIIGAVVPRS